MFTMFTRSIAAFVVAVVLATGSPAMAQSSGLLASAERAALTMEVEQDETVVRRRRSGGLALTGGALAVAGIVFALRPPVCKLQGSGTGEVYGETNPPVRATYTPVRHGGECSILREGYGLDPLSWTNDPRRFEGRAPITKRTWNYVGWATAAAGGALMWFGLRGVDVPVRLDVGPTGGFRVARSLVW